MAKRKREQRAAREEWDIPRQAANPRDHVPFSGLDPWGDPVSRLFEMERFRAFRDGLAVLFEGSRRW